jgi:hypothetical protein
VCQLPDHRVPWCPFAAAPPAPLVGFEDPARENRAIGLESLASDVEPELVETAEGSQVSAAEAGHGGSVSHVEVFQMRRIGTFIFGRPRPLPAARRADRPYTANCEEPLFCS